MIKNCVLHRFYLKYLIFSYFFSYLPFPWEVEYDYFILVENLKLLLTFKDIGYSKMLTWF